MISPDKREALAREIVFAEPPLSIRELLSREGVTDAEYAELLSERCFTERLSELSAVAAEAESARVIRSLGELSKSGDPKVVRLYFDLLEERRSRLDETSALASLAGELWGEDA